jgi:hypothetical protein
MFLVAKIMTKIMVIIYDDDIDYDYTAKGAQGKVPFDSQNGKYASPLSCDASPVAYLPLRVIVKRICHFVSKM